VLTGTRSNCSPVAGLKQGIVSVSLFMN